jgi:hypothetical protein
MSEAVRRNGDLFVLEFQVEQLRTSIAKRGLSGFEEDRAFKAALIQLIADRPAPFMQNYYEHKYLCDLFDRLVGQEGGADADGCYVKCVSAHASIAGSLDQWLTGDARAACLRAALAQLTAGWKLAESGDCEQYRNYLEDLQETYEGVIEGAVSTAIRFDIPLVLPVPDGEYSIRIEENAATIQIAYRPQTASRFGSVVSDQGVQVPVQPGGPTDWLKLPAEQMDKLELVAAKRTTVGFTTVLLTFPRYVNPYRFQFDDEPEDLSRFDFWAPPPSFSQRVQQSMKRMIRVRHSELIELSVKVINRFIDEIRVLGQRHELERIVPADIEYFNVAHLVRNKPFSASTLGEGGSVVITGTGFVHDWVDQLHDNLLSGREIELEPLLLLDGRRYLLQGELRLAVLNINAALESFVNRHFVERMRGVMTDAELEAFLGGQSVFERCKAALAVLAANGDETAKELAGAIPLPQVRDEERLKPSVNKMVTEMNRRVSFGISNTKVSDLVNRIRRHRNEVAHGKYGDSDLDRQKVRDSLEALESFIQLATDTFLAHRAKCHGEPAGAE